MGGGGGARPLEGMTELIELVTLAQIAWWPAAYQALGVLAVGAARAARRVLRTCSRRLPGWSSSLAAALPGPQAEK